MPSPTPLVLVVDDDRAIHELLKEVLEAEGYLVWTLDNGQRVVELLLTASRPCVVLLDMMMPRMSGWDVCGVLASDPRFVRHTVVVMTAGGLTGDRCPAPAFRFLPKPFTLDQLYTVVESLQAKRMLAC